MSTLRSISTPLPTIVLVLATLLVAGCSEADGPDAHGTFEAEEVTVSSEIGGQLLRFDVEAGDRLAAGSPSDTRRVVGLVDTSRLALQRRELRARRRSVRSQISSISAEVEVLAERLRAARRELARVQKLRKGDAAPQRQVDQAADEVRILERRIDATRTQRESLRNEIGAIREQIAQVNERIRKSWVVNPLAGRVLTSYAEKGEVVRTGEPLYTIASLDTLILRAYVSGAQLSNVTIGQQAQVFIDDGPNRRQTLSGHVTWVADEAEFTPTPIQTKEERVDFVYAVKLRVPNPNGAAKIGMPGDVEFRAPDRSTTGTAPQTSANTP